MHLCSIETGSKPAAKKSGAAAQMNQIFHWARGKYTKATFRKVQDSDGDQFSLLSLFSTHVFSETVLRAIYTIL